MKRKRGNPNWGKVWQLPVAVCEFDKLVAEYNLKPEQVIRSFRMREWARENCNKRYIPEKLLEAWGFTPDDQWLM